MRKIQLHKQASKFTLNLPPKQQRQIATTLVRLQDKVEQNDSKKLHGYKYYRIDCGEYRVIYDWDEYTVFVYIIGKRNDDDVYKKAQKLLG